MFPPLSAARTVRPGQQTSSLNSNYHQTVVFDSIPRGIKKASDEEFLPCRRAYVLIYMDEMVKNTVTGKMRKKEKIALGEVIDLRELGILKAGSAAKKMKTPQLERRYASSHETGQCLVRWFSLTINDRSEMAFVSLAPRLQEWRWWGVLSIEATISPCFFDHVIVPGGAKSITTKDRGGKRELDSILDSIRLENPQKEILWK